MTIAQPTNEQVIEQAPTRLQKWWKSFSIIFNSRIAMIGLSMVLFWVILGIISLFWTPYNVNGADFPRNLPPPWVPEQFLSASALRARELSTGGYNLLGADQLGRDIFSRLMHGTQVVLLKTRLPEQLGGFSIPGGVAIWGVVGALSLGSFLGMNAGYRGGWWDQVIMQVLDALVAFPRIVLYLVVIAALGQSDIVIILAIMITGAPGVGRLARSLAMDIKTRDYVRAAETRGESKSYIMFREILPNARGPLLVDGMLRVGYAIFTLATLGFLGVGLPPPDPDWGNMVNDARKQIFSNQLAVLWPAMAIASLVIGLNLFADGLREEITRFQK